MSGLLRGWLVGQDWPTSLTWANACGALAVSCHGCTPAYPSWEELQFFLKRGVRTTALRQDQALEQVHWATNRLEDWQEVKAFAFDHRAQFEEMEGATAEKISRFKLLCLDAAEQVAGGRPGYGLLCDSRLGRESLYRAGDGALWIGRPVEWPGSRPLALEPEIGPDFGGLAEWPIKHVVKVLCFCHPDDNQALWDEQIGTLTRLFQACRRNRLEMLLEVIPSKVGPGHDSTTPAIIQRIYDADIYPDWWKLEPFRSDEAWRAVCGTIERNDPHTRGVVVLGLDAPADQLKASFALAAGHGLVKGFAVGRTIFADAARAWMQDAISDDEAIAQMAKNYASLCRLWDDAKAAVRRARSA
jgi:5-dehydro-2-deoxygluconokinase